MSPSIPFQPAGWRAPIIPITRGRRRGLGQNETSYNYAQLAQQFPPSSGFYTLLMGCAANAPGNPSIDQNCAANVASVVATSVAAGAPPNTIMGTTADQTAFNQAIAAGSIPPPAVGTIVTPNAPTPAQISTPPPTSTPTPAPTVAPTPAPTSMLQLGGPVQLVQPAGAPQPMGPSMQEGETGTGLSSSLLGIPIWVWGLGAVGVVLMFSMGGQR